MDKKIKFEIVTPEKIVLKDMVSQIVIPTKSGQITVLPKHVPLVSMLAPGEIVLTKDGKKEFFSVFGGFVEVLIDKVVVLADTAERAEDIDIKRAEEAKKRAEDLKSKKTSDSMEFTAISANIEKELTRIRVARKYKKYKNL